MPNTTITPTKWSTQSMPANVLAQLHALHAKQYPEHPLVFRVWLARAIIEAFDLEEKK